MWVIPDFWDLLFRCIYSFPYLWCPINSIVISKAGSVDDLGDWPLICWLFHSDPTPPWVSSSSLRQEDKRLHLLGWVYSERKMDLIKIYIMPGQAGDECQYNSRALHIEWYWRYALPFQAPIWILGQGRTRIQWSIGGMVFYNLVIEQNATCRLFSFSAGPCRVTNFARSHPQRENTKWTDKGLLQHSGSRVSFHFSK